MKKLLALCISVVTMLSLSLSLLASPVSAELYYSDREEYDLHISVEGSDSDVYLKFTDDSLTHGIWYEFTNIYTSVYITVSDASTGDALVAALGEEPSDITEVGQ